MTPFVSFCISEFQIGWLQYLLDNATFVKLKQVFHSDVNVNCDLKQKKMCHARVFFPIVCSFIISGKTNVT